MFSIRKQICFHDLIKESDDNKAEQTCEAAFDSVNTLSH